MTTKCRQHLPRSLTIATLFVLSLQIYFSEVNGQTQTPDVCQLPKEQGPCEAHIQRWFYDTERKRCQRFIYGGCSANANNFPTNADCKRMCVKHVTLRQATDVCRLPMLIGPCKAAQPRWYFDTTLRRCKKFEFGGCRGNGNNFDTEAECKGVCVHNVKTRAATRRDRGHGRGRSKSPDDLQHVEERAVTDVCTQPKADGPCQAFFPMWYFDADNNKCSKFIYGGCHGNENRFETADECEAKCVPEPQAKLIR